MATVFVDAGALYALVDAGDRWHAAALRTARMLEGSDLVTTDLALAEAWFLVRSRIGRDVAMRFWDEVRRGVVRVEVPTDEDLGRAWEIAGEFADQDFSFTDCVSFAFLERHRIRRAFSFDRHFAVFRFGPRRTEALEVLGRDRAG